MEIFLYIVLGILLIAMIFTIGMTFYIFIKFIKELFWKGKVIKC